MTKSSASREESMATFRCLYDSVHFNSIGADVVGVGLVFILCRQRDDQAWEQAEDQSGCCKNAHTFYVAQCGGLRKFLLWAQADLKAGPAAPVLTFPLPSVSGSAYGILGLSSFAPGSTGEGSAA